VAEKFYLQKFILSPWREYTKNSKLRRDRADEMLVKNRNAGLSNVISAWRTETVKTRPIRLKIYQKQDQLLKSCLIAWYDHHRRMKKIENQISADFSPSVNIDQNSATNIVKIWHDRLLLLRRNRVKSYLVTISYENKLLKNVLKNWNQTAIIPEEKIPNQEMTQIRLKISFSHWLKITKLKKLGQKLEKSKKIGHFEKWQKNVSKKQEFTNLTFLWSYQK